MTVKLVIGAVPNQPVRFSYAYLFQPRLNDKNGKMEYSVTGLIHKSHTEDIKKIRDAIALELKREFTDKGKRIPPGAWNPLRDGDTDAKQNGEPLGAECKGHYVLHIKTEVSRGTPTVVDARVQKILDPKGLISGDFGAVSLNLKAYETGSGGVGAYLINVQKLRDGEPLSSGNSRAEDDFTAVTEDFLN